MSANSLARRPVSNETVPSGRMFRAGLATLLFFMLPVAAEAYTLVLRSGRHVTVPDDFEVTPTAVIYEASPGFSVTVWLSNVDFAATERANGEPAGNFARRIKQEPEGADAPACAPEATKAERRAGRKVVTNKELEPSRLRREAQEEEYERTRRERGMPSRRELQQRVEEQDRELREWARQMEAERREAELEALRSELVNVRRQLDELNLHLSRQAAADGSAYAPPNGYPYFYAPPVQVITVLPFGHRGRFGRGHFGPHPHGRRWPFNPRPGHTSPPIYVSPSRSAGPLPRA
ncbi:MAG: hypothetical protein M3416_14335, partial [Acidobacteriota bacterium]|nr:hypothetical protein [Acidobacteriota bacterium]